MLLSCCGRERASSVIPEAPHVRVERRPEQMSRCVIRDAATQDPNKVDAGEVHTHTHTCLYVFINTHTHVQTATDTHIYTHTHTHTHIHTHAHIHTQRSVPVLSVGCSDLWYDICHAVSVP